MAPRGRPRLVQLEPPTTLENKVAEILAEECNILGCKPAFHLTAAKEIIAVVKDELREKINS